MKKIICITWLTGLFITGFSQKFTISGYVYDESTREVLIGAVVYDSTTLKGTITNSYGFYSLSTSNYMPVLLISYLGYTSKTEKPVLPGDTSLDINLTPKTSQLNEVVITGKSKYNPLSFNEFNIKVLDQKTIETLPILFGEKDVIKGIQLENGVTSLGEGSSGVYVQGGNTDQNLIIIDEAAIYNPSHLFGLVSVFNPDAIKNVEFYKGAIPAQFGGRLSSVINCQMNDGNKRQTQFYGGIGTLTMHASVEGPVKKDTASYLLAVRRSVRDIFMNPDKEVTYVPQFYDINAKLNWNLDEKNKFFLSLYSGRDEIKSYDDFSNIWGNNMVSFRWNHIITKRLFSSFSAIYSKYNNDLKFIASGKNYSWLTGVEDFMGKLNFTWFITPDNKIRYGAESIYHKYTPGENNNPGESLFRIDALESSAYILHDITLVSWLGLNYGIRYSMFQNTGRGKWYSYDEVNNPVLLNENENGIYHACYYFEPRVTVNLKPARNHAVKLSYNRTVQYAQILQNSVFSYTSLQSWLPANPNIEPLYADIFSLGYFSDYPGGYSLSLETFYKNMNHIVDFIDHAQLVNNPYIETQIKTGKGNAYGFSVQLKRKTEKLEADVSYTYSRVLYAISGINNGNAYPALQDIPNDIRIKAIYHPLQRIGISAFWTYHTGFVVTLPTGNVNGIPLYTSRNGGRLPDYHRLDISLFLYPKTGSKRWKGTWSAGVYNAYGRFNPIGLNLSEGTEDTVYLFTLYRVVPFISYNFKF